MYIFFLLGSPTACGGKTSFSKVITPNDKEILSFSQSVIMMKQAVFFSAYSWLELQHDLIKLGNMDRTQILDQVSLTLKGRVNNTQNSHFLIRYIAENGCD